ncbi:sugar phosphate isomerase/epimerase, partial [Streptomyces sp. ActVer]|nr:sugar phosphate isomerase/epimerase [Streptomyces sp. ActVer]
IDQGEVDWNAFFGTLRELNFDGVATACVFAWEERAHESSAFMLDRITKELTV